MLPQIVNLAPLEDCDQDFKLKRKHFEKIFIKSSQHAQFEMHLGIKECFQNVEGKWNFGKFVFKYLLYTFYFIKSILRNVGTIEKLILTHKLI